MGELVRLHSQDRLLTELVDDTIVLIHATKKVPAIKMLVEAHDILELNLTVIAKHPEIEICDQGAFKYLDRIRKDLCLKYGDFFEPPVLVPKWYKKLGSLFWNVKFKSN